MAAPAYRASGAATDPSSTTTVTITKPTGTTSGDILYAIIANGGANAAPTSVPSGWTLVDSGGVTPSNPMWGGLYRLVAGGSEPADYTWSGMTDSCTGCIIAISGADTTTPEQVHAVRFNASGSTGTAGITTTGADTLVISAFAEDDNNAVTTTSWTCATDPTTLTHRIEQRSDGGNDTGSAFSTATKATAGATGASAFTLSAARQNVSFLLAAQAPSGSNATITPNPISATTTLPAPTPTADSTATPAAITTTTTLPATTITAETRATPDPIAATTDLPAITVATESTATPSAIESAATLPAVAVVAVTTINPDPIGAVTELPAVTVSAGSTVTSAVILAIASMPSPDLSTGATASPSPISATTTIPAPTVSTESTVTPDAITGTTALPTPAVSTDTTAAPAAISVSLGPLSTACGDDPEPLPPRTIMTKITTPTSAIMPDR